MELGALQTQSLSNATGNATLNSAKLALNSAANGGKHDKLRQASEEFEAVFMSKMLETMFSGLSTEAPFGGGNAEETWRGFLVEEYGKQITASGGVGLADSIHRQLLQLQEAKS